MSELKLNLLAQLQAYVRDISPVPTPEQCEKLVDYVLLMHKWNKAYNLTSVREPEKMLVKHIVDSIAVTPFLHKQQYIDVGTGPGLPGIPLAIMCPDKQFILLDSLGKRVRFMTQVAYELKLPNIQPVQARVEDYQPTGRIDGVISRAFASLKDMLHWCPHLVDSEGVFLALKGQLPSDEMADIPAGFMVEACNKLAIPGLEGERHIVHIRKS